MSITIDLLLKIAARSPRAAEVLIVRDPGSRGRIGAELLTDQVACWSQTALPMNASQAQRTVARAEVAAAARLAATRRGWLQPVEVEDEHEEASWALITTYVFKAQ